MQYDKDFQSLKNMIKCKNMYIFEIWYKHIKPGREVYKMDGRMELQFNVGGI